MKVGEFFPLEKTFACKGGGEPRKDGRDQLLQEEYPTPVPLYHHVLGTDVGYS